jgi:type I site-specific restriction endonuclease
LNISKKNRKTTCIWKLNNSPLNDHLVKEKVKKEIKDYLEFNENIDTSYQNLQDIMKAVLSENSYSKCPGKETCEILY